MASLGRGSADIYNFDIYMIHHETEFYCGRYSSNIDGSKKGGLEAFCNLEAKDVRIEGIPDNGATSWKVFMCTFGLFGTIYEPPTPVPESVDIWQGLTILEIMVTNVQPRAGLEVTYDLYTNLR